jgi:hypothetical protein
VDLIVPVEETPELRMKGTRLAALKSPIDSAQQVGAARLKYTE